jgi:hypothetical protein
VVVEVKTASIWTEAHLFADATLCNTSSRYHTKMQKKWALTLIGFLRLLQNLAVETCDELEYN